MKKAAKLATDGRWVLLGAQIVAGADAKTFALIPLPTGGTQGRANWYI